MAQQSEDLIQLSTYRAGDNDQPPADRDDGLATGTSPGSIGSSAS